MPTKHRAIEILRFGFGHLRGTKRNRRRTSWRPRIEGLEERSLLSLSTISVSDPAFDGVTGIGRARNATLSANGRYSVFESDAPDLVAGDLNGGADVFLRDLVAGTTTLVSVNAAGMGTGNGVSSRAVISDDGRWVAFNSSAPDLIPGQTHYGNGLYIRDLIDGVTYFGAVKTDGSTPTTQNDGAYELAISQDGGRVAFTTSGALSPNDLNGMADVYVWDRATARTILVSARSNGQAGDGYSNAPMISADGSRVAFTSMALDFVPGGTLPYVTRLYLRDLDSGTTMAVDAKPDGTVGDGPSARASMSRDGHTIAFTHYGDDLVAGDTNGAADLFLWSEGTGSTSLTRLTTDHNQAYGGFYMTSLSADGSTLAFASDARDLVAGQLIYGDHIYAWTAASGVISLVDKAVSGGGAGNSYYGTTAPVVSLDGLTVTYASMSTNLVADMSTSAGNIFQYNLTTGTTRLISVDLNGQAAGQVDSYGYTQEPPAVSEDGSTVVFTSNAVGLVAGDNNERADVFARRPDGTGGYQTALVSAKATAADYLGIGSGASERGRISADGRYIVFESDAKNLVAGTGLSAYDSFRTIYLRDLATGTTTLVGYGPEGQLMYAISPVISADGRYVAFDGGYYGHVYVRDLVAGTTVMVDVADEGTTANGASRQPRISGDGRYIVFASDASNLVPDDSDGNTDLYIRDMATGTTRLITHIPGGGTDNGYPSDYVISRNGRTVAFLSYASDLVPGDTNNNLDVFVYDTLAGTVKAATENYQGTGTSTDAWNVGSLSISDDGRLVAFNAIATDLLPSPTSGSHIYVRDVSTDITILVDAIAGASVTPSYYGAYGPVISGNGRYVIFQSPSRDLIDGSSYDSFAVPQLLKRDLVTGTTTVVSVAADGISPSNEQAEPRLISNDGRYIAFISRSNNLTSGVTTNLYLNVYVRDTVEGVTYLATQNADGQGINEPNRYGYVYAVPVSMSDDGGSLVIESDSTGLVANDFNGLNDVFLFQLTDRIGSSVDLAVAGAPPTLAGHSVTFVATVNVSGVPSGIVTFYDNGEEVGQSPLGLDGTASFTLSTSGVGSHSITASFAGAGYWPSESSSVGFDLVKDSSTVVLTSSANPTAMGTPVTIIATVAGATPGGPVVTGTVTFKDGETVLGTVTLDATGTAAFTTSELAGGSHTITAEFSGDDNLDGVVSAGLEQAIQAATATVGFSLQDSTVTFGTSVTFSAYLYRNNSSDPVPTGFVTFRDGLNFLGRAPIVQGGYVYFATPTPLAPGTHSIVALYEGDRTFSSTISDARSLSVVLVTETAPKIQLITSANPASIGTTSSGSSTDPVVSPNGRYVVFTSDATNLVLNDPYFGTDLYIKDLQTGTTRLITTATYGLGASAYPENASFSQDGRYVVYQANSGLTELPEGTDSGTHIYRYDIARGINELVSVGMPGISTGYYSVSSRPSISADGRYIAFISDSPNLVPNDSPYTRDVFVRDMTTGVTTLASIDLAGFPAGGVDTYSGAPRISADGRYVVFGSYADTIMLGDDNPSGLDIFVRDLVAGETLCVSARQDGSPAGYSYNPSISADGRYVAFTSDASGLTADDANGWSQVYLHDLVTGATTLITRGESGQLSQGGTGRVEITRDGRHVVFQGSYYYSGLLAGENPSGQIYTYSVTDGTLSLVQLSSPDVSNLQAYSFALADSGRYLSLSAYGTGFPDGASIGFFLADLDTGTTDLIGVNAASDYSVRSPTISADGSIVAYASLRSDLVAGDVNGYSDVFARSTADGSITLVSNRLSGNPSSTAGGSSDTRITPDGRYLLFSTIARSIDPNDRNVPGLFVRDMITGATTLVSVNSAGTGTGNSSVGEATISADGRYVAFYSNASDLVPGHGSGLFLRDLATGTTSFITGGYAYSIQISGDGRYVAFASYDGSLATSDTNDGPDIYVYDRQASSFKLISAKAGAPGTTGNSYSQYPRFSADGSTIAFISNASDLVAGDTNARADIFVYNMATGVTALVSATPSGGSGNGDSSSYDFSLSDDGRYVAFMSNASDLVPGDDNNTYDVFLRDTVAGTTRLVSARAADGKSGNNGSFGPSLSGDGRYVAFTTYASDLIAGQPISGTNILVFDAVTGVLTQANVHLDGSTYGSAVESPVISGDGRWLAFQSTDGNLVAGGSSGRNLFLRDLQAGTTRILTPGIGSYSTYFNGAVRVSRGGGVVVFTTNKPDLVANDFNGQQDIFAYVDPDNVSIVSTTTTLSLPNQPAVFGQSITLVATVTPTDGSTFDPTGTVTFLEGSTILGTATVVNGSATLTISTLGVGSHSITASYLGSTNYSGSTSSQSTQTVNRASATTTLDSTDSSSVFGQSVTFTATVSAASPGSGMPTGSILFKDGETILGTVALDEMGHASFQTSALGVANHVITATYQGDIHFLDGAVASLSQAVDKSATSVSIVSSDSSTTIGDSVTFTATVLASAPGVGTPSGLVRFLDGGVPLGDVLLTGSGTASFTVSGLSPGEHTITASYLGDGQFLAAAGDATQSVAKITPSETLTFSPTSLTFGDEVTFIAIVTSGYGTPTGTVTFRDGATSLVVVDLIDGVATYTISTLSAGTHSFTASYSGDSNHEQTSITETYTVAKVATVATVSILPSESVFGQTVQLTASVTSTVGVPDGLITFLVDGVPIGYNVALNGSGVASTLYSGLTVGAHQVVASYVGTDTFQASNSAPAQWVVSQGSTTIALSSWQPSSPFGEDITFAATVSHVAPSETTPGGTVVFFVDGEEIGSSLVSHFGRAYITVNQLTLGDHEITASYLGNVNSAGSSSSAISQSVVRVTTTTGLTASSTQSTFGASVTFTATVTPQTTGAGTPTGSVIFADAGTILATVPLDALGVATFQTTSLPRGDRMISATFVASGPFFDSSATISHTVEKEATSIALTAPTGSLVAGQALTLTATVSTLASAGVPGGTVTFYDSSGSISLGTASLNASGVATFVARLHAGAHQITASYLGSDDFKPSNSASVSRTVAQASTTAALTVSPATGRTFGQNITLTAQISPVAPGTGAPSGSVVFLDGATEIGTASLDGLGRAVLLSRSLAVGSHAFSIRFDGDTDFLASTASTSSVTISAAPSTTILTTDAIGNTTYGQPVAFTARVVTAGADLSPPTGTVTFKDGSTVLGTATLDSNGQALFSTNTLALGTRSITAVYASTNPNNLGGSSSVLTQVVVQAATTAKLDISSSATVYGEALVLTATILPPDGNLVAPNGSVTFRDGTTALGTVTLVGGSATFTTKTLTVGSHGLTVSYLGNSNFSASASDPASVDVAQASSAVSLVVTSQSGGGLGEAVTMRVTLTANSPSTLIPSGSVEIFDGGSRIASVNVTSTGVYQYSTSSLAAGTHELTARYVGSANFIASVSDPVSVEVAKAATTIAVTSSLSPSTFGQAITLRATFGAAGSFKPTGSVVFSDGSIVLGTANISNGVASLTVANVPAGIRTITASYAESANFLGGTGTLSQDVAKATTTTTLSASSSAPVFGQPLILTATVKNSLTNSIKPTGLVVFSDGASVLGTANLVGGVAQFTITSLDVGDHALTAEYQGDDNDLSSLGTLSRTVGMASANVTVSTSASAMSFGQSVTFTAIVTPAAPSAGLPTGSIIFKDGTVDLGTVTLDASGKAEFTSSTLAAGTHRVTAVYVGDTSFKTKTSSNVTVVVAKIGTTLSLSSSLSPSAYGQSVTFTAILDTALPEGGPATGSIVFKNGTSTLGTVLVVDGVATFTTSTLALGERAITASYTGSAVHLASTASATQVVTATATATSVTSLDPDAVVGQSVRLVATVSPTIGSAIPTGSVTFYDAGALLGTASLSGGTAVLTTKKLTIGTHAITVSYAGAGSYNPSVSDSLTQAIVASSTVTTLTSSIPSPVVGQLITFTATVAAVTPGSGLPIGSVTFYDQGEQIGTANLSSGVARLSIKTLSVGSHAITALYSGDTSYLASTAANLNVTIGLSETATTVTTSAATAVFGQPLTFTAKVVAVTPGSGTPGGVVTFLDGSTVLGSVPLVSGTARFDTSVLTLGTHSISVIYSGNESYANSASSSLAQAVNAASTTTSLASSLNTSVFGQVVTYIATIRPVAPGTGSPTGMVTFYDGGIAIGTVSISGGVASLATSLSVGAHSLAASYSGDGNYNASATTTALSRTVALASTTLALTSSLTPSTFGQSVSFTATVTAVAPGSGVPAGTVTFKDGTTVLATVTLDANGSATLDTSSLTGGPHVISATFAGDSFKTSSRSITQTVTAATTATTLSTSTTSAVSGQAVTLTAAVVTIAPGSGIPSGTVTFRRGTTVLATVPLQADGTASFTTSALPVGSASLTATFNQQSSYKTSVSDTLVLPVDKAATNTTISASSPSIGVGDEITLTIEVAPVTPGTGVPTGVVTIKNGATTIGTGNLVNGILTFKTRSLAQGERHLTATYAGGSLFLGSTSTDLIVNVG